MKIIALERELSGTADEDFTPHQAAEAARVYELYQEGVIRELYFRQDQNCALLVLECADLQAAGKFLDTLPLVRERLITFDLIPLRPYPGFSRLFNEK